VATDYSWAVDLLAARAQQTFMPPEDARAVYVQLSLMYEVFQDFEAAVHMLDRVLSIEADEAWRDRVQQKIDTMQQKIKALQE
jgi:prefoldin subunit 5